MYSLNTYFFALLSICFYGFAGYACPVTISASNTTPCGQTIVIFTVAPYNQNYTYTWDFDDPGSVDNTITTSNDSVTHSFSPNPNGGAHVVTVTVEDQNGVICDTTININTGATPKIEINRDPDPCIPIKDSTQQIRIVNVCIISAPGVGHNWYIENKDTFIANIDSCEALTLNQYGAYPILITDSIGTCEGRYLDTIRFYTKPLADLRVVGVTGQFCEGEVVRVKNLTNPINVSWYEFHWGDGAVDTLYDNSDTSHIYNFDSPQICMPYDLPQVEITLVPQNECLFQSPLSQSSLIDIKIEPRAAFGWANTSLCFPDINGEVSFINYSCPLTSSPYNFIDPLTFQWNFDDNSPISSDENPVHIYASSGCYNVTLTASNSCGSNAVTKKICLERPPQLAFNLNTTAGCVPPPVPIVATSISTHPSTYDVVYAWTIYNSAGTPIHTGPDNSVMNYAFSSPGIFSICLNESNACVVADICRTITINAKPSVSISIPDSCHIPYCINPIAHVNGNGLPIDSVEWSITAQPSFTDYPPAGTLIFDSRPTPNRICFTNPGTYYVSVTAWDSCGSTREIDTITISNPPNITVVPNNPTVCIGDLVTLFADRADTFSWNKSLTFFTYVSDSADTVKFIAVRDTSLIVTGYKLPDKICYDTAHVKIHVIPQQNITMPLDIEVCESADSILLRGASPSGGTWGGPHVTVANNDTFFYPDTCNLQPYEIIYTVGNTTGCNSRDTMKITVHCPQLVAVTDTTVCQDNSCIPLSDLVVDPFFGCAWTDSTGDTITQFCIIGIRTHRLVYSCVDANGCINRDTSFVTVQPPSNADAGNDFNLCEGEIKSICPTPSPGDWESSLNNGISGPDVSGCYTYMADNFGTDTLIYKIFPNTTCADADTVFIRVHQLPQLSLAATQLSICERDSVTITASADFPVQWTQPIDGRILPGGFSIIVSPPVGITCYQVTVVDQVTLCERTDQICIDVNARPVVGMSFGSIGCIGQSVQFNDASSPNGLAYHWDFSDTNTSTDQHPRHTYLYSDTFPVTHTVAFGNTGCEAETTATIIIKDTAIANFTLDTVIGCDPLSVSITNLSSGDDLEYFWIKRQLLPSAGLPDTFSKLPSPGNVILNGIQGMDVEYEIKLILRTAHCNTDSIAHTVTVLSKPVAKFGMDWIISCDSLNGFHYYSEGFSVLSEWYINDSLFFTGKFPVPDTFFSWNNTDTTDYEIMLVDSNQCGEDSMTAKIHVLPPTVYANFGILKYQGCEPFTVELHNHATGASEIDYDFGGIGTMDSVMTDTSFTFPIAGTYTIYQYAKGCGHDTALKVITVLPAPHVDFEADSEGCVGQPITIVNLSDRDSISSYIWDYGDDSTSTSPDSVHTHVYLSDSTYSIILKGNHWRHSDCPGYDTASVIIHPLPPVDFLPRDTFGCAPFTVQFISDTCAPGRLALRWDFGDGDSSVICDPAHTYDLAGTYIVQLSDTDLFTGCFNDTAIAMILVHPSPVSSFAILNTDTCDVPIALDLINLSVGANSPFMWDFGDSIWIQNDDSIVPKAYLTSGDTTIRLAVVNSDGCVDTSSHYFQAIDIPDLNFSVSPSSGCEPLCVVFHLDSNKATSYLWDFGDLTTGTDQNPQHCYSAGQYTVRVELTYENGICFDTIEIPNAVLVHPTPVADFYFEENTTPVYDGTYVFNNTSAHSDSFTWDYDWHDGDYPDAVGITDTVTTYRYYENREFIVRLISSNEFCADTVIAVLMPDFLGGLFVPNAFTPESGQPFGVNVFKPKGVGLAEYEIEIYSPAGTLLWESDKIENGMPAEGWDGNYKGKPMQQDAYVWRVRAIFQDGRVWQGMPNKDGKLYRIGTVTLIR